MTVKLAVIPKNKWKRATVAASGYLKFMYPLIYCLHAEFNLSEMQREGRQLERAMIADAKSLWLTGYFISMPKWKKRKRIQSMYSLEVAVEYIYCLNLISNSWHITVKHENLVMQTFMQFNIELNVRLMQHTPVITFDCYLI